MTVTITPKQKAIDGFEQWFEQYPGVKNPTDINCREKYEFAMEIGWSTFRQMQQYRKSNSGDQPNPWTKAEYWEDKYPVNGTPAKMTKPHGYQEEATKKLYKEWFTKYPTLKNPTDVNRREKFEFALKIGWDNYAMMQHARKQNVARLGYPTPWTQPEYWEN